LIFDDCAVTQNAKSTSPEFQPSSINCVVNQECRATAEQNHLQASSVPVLLLSDYNSNLRFFWP